MLAGPLPLPTPTPTLSNDPQHDRSMHFHHGPSAPGALTFGNPTGSQEPGRAPEQWDASSGGGGGGHGLSPQTIRSSVSDPSGTRPITAIQRWHSLSRSLALVHFSIDEIVTRCFDSFFEYLYPLTPLVHEPSLREGLAFFLQTPLSSSEAGAAQTANDDSWLRTTTSGFPRATGAGAAMTRTGMEPWPDATFTLITAVCAEAAFLLPKHIFTDGESVADIFLQASRNCLNDYLEADLESPNANSITIRYFHSNCLHAAGKPKYSWHIFGEATRLAQVMQLHEESSLEGLFAIEAELRRRAFWIVYMGDKSAAILNNRPITIHKFSFESGITTCYPTGIEDESPMGPSPTSGPASASDTGGRRSFIEGFNANLRLWQTASDLLLEIRLLEDARDAAAAAASTAPSDAPPQAQPTAPQRLNGEERQKLDELYVRFITCLDELPPYLQSYTFAAIASGGKQTTRSNQFIIQCANLQVSLHCLRMVITQKFEDLSYFGASKEQADLRRTEIARDMIRVINEAPFWSLQVNGEPYVSIPTFHAHAEKRS